MPIIRYRDTRPLKGVSFEYGLVSPSGKFVHAQHGDAGHRGVAKRLGYEHVPAALKAGHIRWWVDREGSDPPRFGVEWDERHPEASKNAKKLFKYGKKLKMDVNRQNAYKIESIVDDLISGLSIEEALRLDERYEAHGWIQPDGKYLYGQHMYDHHATMAERHGLDYHGAMNAGWVRFRHDNTFGSLIDYTETSSTKHAINHIEKNAESIRDEGRLTVYHPAGYNSFDQPEEAIHFLKRTFPVGSK